jgi:hypothetical protein
MADYTYHSVLPFMFSLIRDKSPGFKGDLDENQKKLWLAVWELKDQVNNHPQYGFASSNIRQYYLELWCWMKFCKFLARRSQTPDSDARLQGIHPFLAFTLDLTHLLELPHLAQPQIHPPTTLRTSSHRLERTRITAKSSTRYSPILEPHRLRFDDPPPKIGSSTV